MTRIWCKTRMAKGETKAHVENLFSDLRRVVDGQPVQQFHSPEPIKIPSPNGTCIGDNILNTFRQVFEMYEAHACPEFIKKYFNVTVTEEGLIWRISLTYPLYPRQEILIKPHMHFMYFNALVKNVTKQLKERFDDWVIEHDEIEPPVYDDFGNEIRS